MSLDEPKGWLGPRTSTQPHLDGCVAALGRQVPRGGAARIGTVRRFLWRRWSVVRCRRVVRALVSSGSAAADSPELVKLRYVARYQSSSGLWYAMIHDSAKPAGGGNLGLRQLELPDLAALARPGCEFRSGKPNMSSIHIEVTQQVMTRKMLAPMASLAVLLAGGQAWAQSATTTSASCPAPTIVVAGHPRLEILHISHDNKVAIPFSDPNFSGTVSFVGSPAHHVPELRRTFHVSAGAGTKTVHVQLAASTARSLPSPPRQPRAGD